jgi:hypothetical protein
MNKCLNCGAEIIQKNGSRERKFCDNQNKCKQAYHNKIKREPKYVQFKTYKDLLEKYDELVTKSSAGLKEIAPPVIKRTSEAKVIHNKITGKHKLWKEGDPSEGSAAFFLKYSAMSYDEIITKGITN